MILRRKNSYKNLILSEATFGGLPLAYWPMNDVAGASTGGADGWVSLG